jgi:hypothetical protein
MYFEYLKSIREKIMNEIGILISVFFYVFRILKNIFLGRKNTKKYWST